MRYIKINYIIFCSVFLSLIVPLLVSGPFLPDLIVSLSSLIFLIYVFKNKVFFYFTKKPLVIFFIFCIYIIFVSIFSADNVKLSFESSLFYFRIGIFSCLVWYLINQNNKIIDYFYYSLVLSFSALVIDGYFQYLTGFNLIGTPLQGVRVSSFFGDELIMGSYLSRLYPFALAIFILRKNSKPEFYLICFLFVLTSGLIFISGERTALFFHLLSLTFIIILTKKLKLNKFLIFFGLIFAIITFSSINENLKKRMLMWPFDEMNISAEKKYVFTPAHDSLVKTAYNMFLDKPIFGHGPKMFRVICKNKKYATGVSPCMSHPHNFYIQLLAETGIVGFMFLFSALTYIIYCALRQLKTFLFKEQSFLTDYQVCLLACLLITLWPLSPNGNFFNNWLAICYSLPVGFYLQSIYGNR